MKKLLMFFTGIILGLIPVFSMAYYPEVDYSTASSIPVTQGQTDLIYGYRNSVTSGYYGNTGFGQAFAGYPYNATYLYAKWIPAKSRYVCQIDYNLRVVGNPTDSLDLEVWEGGSWGSNSRSGGILVGTGEFVASGLYITRYSGYTNVSFKIGTGDCINMQQAKTYWFILKRSGANSITDYYQAGLQYSTGGQVVTEAPNGENRVEYLSDISNECGTGCDAVADLILTGKLNAPLLQTISNSTCTFNILDPFPFVSCIFIPSASNLTSSFGGFTETLNTKFAVLTDAIAFLPNIVATFGEESPNINFDLMGGTMNFNLSYLDVFMTSIRPIIGVLLLISLAIYIIKTVPTILKS